MELDINKVIDKIKQSDFVENFIKELSKELEKNNTKSKDLENTNLTKEEQLELERREFSFLQEFFQKELADVSKGEAYIVTNKYENDTEYNRYKVTQYKDNLECKYIALGKDLPENIQLRDVVRKVDGKYIYDYQATKYVAESIKQIKQDIINKRK